MDQPRPLAWPNAIVKLSSKYAPLVPVGLGVSDLDSEAFNIQGLIMMMILDMVIVAISLEAVERRMDLPQI